MRTGNCHHLLPDGRALYGTNSLDGGISKIDAENNKMLKHLMAAGGQDIPLRNLAEDPATSRLFVTDKSKANNSGSFDSHLSSLLVSPDGHCSLL